jgi:hypothetical protein
MAMSVVSSLPWQWISELAIVIVVSNVSRNMSICKQCVRKYVYL